MTDNPITDEEIAAFGLAVHIRARLIESGEGRRDYAGDAFPVENWRERYAVALQFSKDNAELYPNPLMRVHKMQPFLAQISELD